MSRFAFRAVIIIASLVVLYFMAGDLFEQHKIPTVAEFSSTTSQIFGDEALQASSSPSASPARDSSFLEFMNSMSSSTARSAQDAQDISAAPKNSFSSMKATTVYASKGSIKAFIADTDDARELGLSGQSDLSTGTGMLFVFDTAGKHGFWMKDMSFPIVIVWIDSNKKIAGVTRNVLPKSYPFVFMPPKDILYVIEVNAGKATSLGLVTGTSVEFSIDHSAR